MKLIDFMKETKTDYQELKDQLYEHKLAHQKNEESSKLLEFRIENNHVALKDSLEKAQQDLCDKIHLEKVVCNQYSQQIGDYFRYQFTWKYLIRPIFFT